MRESEIKPRETDITGIGEREVSPLAAVIRQNRPLSDGETNNGTSTVCEPSLGVRGQEILYTGNWFASFSKNGGASFTFRNPSTAFPQIPGRPFCCDQVAHYVKSHDLMVWYLQYSNDATGNTVRIAVASGDDIRNEAWRYYDFTPQEVGGWSGEWFDYPDISHSNQFLFLTTNCFSSTDQFRRSVMLRLPLDELRSYSALNYRYLDRTDVGSLRPTQNAGDTMYVGAHRSTGRIRVYRWADNDTSVQNKEFDVQPWVRGGARAPGPDGRDWLGFSDGRITAAWSQGRTQGFGWTSAQGGTYTMPNARMAVIDWDAGTVPQQPHIWNNQIAFAYPAVDVNSTGQVGVIRMLWRRALLSESRSRCVEQRLLMGACRDCSGDTRSEPKPMGRLFDPAHQWPNPNTFCGHGVLAFGWHGQSRN